MDRDGQPAARFNGARNKRKALNALLGLLSGLAADRRLRPEEAVLLDAWLREQQFLRGDADVTDILDATGDVLAAGEVSADGLEDLLGLVDTVLQYRTPDLEGQTDLANHLLGLVQGITADRALHDLEISHLNYWLARCGAADDWPFGILRKRMAAVLKDGVVTHDERAEGILPLLMVGAG